MAKELTTEVGRGCFYTLILIGRLDVRTPPEIMLIISLCFFTKTDLEKCRITSLAHQRILCSEWVPSE